MEGVSRWLKEAELGGHCRVFMENHRFEGEAAARVGELGGWCSVDLDTDCTHTLVFSTEA